ncbi:hypothetical protein [Parasporobacterium paucivorans]|uniref:Uncharacterized protein n=1 Tax=Parasporobacterium paucivorans DSM 15970 TaxID=1122934 RepID=A0A1M6IPQ6_9FIRM|nr:hypothetical protein [Parasporobacterium paucivorans]SHJ36436.1 hypothetical protein SAMN02745691_01818 [Parasporobacterium paucivorans DSM 15970]
MAKRDRYDVLVILTNNAALIWKEARGIAPDSAADKLDDAMLEWQSELTKALIIWIDKSLTMTTGELILARANLGAVVESWLKFFYCVYYEDYCKSPITNKKGKMIEPEKASFDNLKDFSSGKLWNDENSPEYAWVNSVQHKRNAIHSFRYRDIGTPLEFLDDIDHLYDFVDNVLSHFPPLEDYIESYPAGYVMNPYFD